MKKKNYLVVLLFMAVSSQMTAQETMNLEHARQLAIANSKELKISDAKKEKAYYDKKSAFTNYLPKVSLSGGYVHTDKEISLLSDDQKNALENLGYAVGQKLPQLESMAPALNALGTGLVDGLRTDTRNIGTASVMLTQPLYMGGKIIAYNKITRYAEQIAANSHDLELQNLIVEVDETYWKIVQLRNQMRLAQSYLDVVTRLDNDVDQMIREGIATKSDGLSVKVKVNEAKVTLIQIGNGLSLCRMKLGQLCGIEDHDNIILAEESADVLPTVIDEYMVDTDLALSARLELKSLDLATNIYNEKVKIARSEFLPTIALTGGYLASNPSCFNGFEKKFEGMWNVGVIVNVPLVTWGDRFYKVKAAKAEAREASYRLEETREKIELQVSQSQQKLQEARERFLTAQKSQEEADENLRYANYGLQEGVVTISNVLQAETAWLMAHSTFINAQVDVLLSDLYLRKSIGSLNY